MTDLSCADVIPANIFNCIVLTQSLQMIDDLAPAQLDHADPDYEVLIAVRARRPLPVAALS